MLSDVPNMAFTLGYTNASWTLKADLTSEYMCRLIDHMDAQRLRASACRGSPTPSVESAPVIDLNSGYVLRSLEQLPKQGTQGAMEAAPELRGRPAGAAPRVGRSTARCSSPARRAGPPAEPEPVAAATA